MHIMIKVTSGNNISIPIFQITKKKTSEPATTIIANWLAHNTEHCEDVPTRNIKEFRSKIYVLNYWLISLF
jgi:hypothetical protein